MDEHYKLRSSLPVVFTESSDQIERHRNIHDTSVSTIGLYFLLVLKSWSGISMFSKQPKHLSYMYLQQDNSAAQH